MDESTLFDAHLDGTLDHAGAARLTALLGDRAARARFVAALGERVALADLSRQLSAAASARWRRPAPALLAAAAVLASAIGGGIWWRHDARPAPTLAVEAGPVAIDGVAWPVAAARTLAADAAIHLEADAVATLAWGDGTRIALHGPVDAGAATAAAGKRVELRRGALSAEVAPQPAGHPLVIATPHADAEIVGTRFDLDVGAASSRLAVREGRVRFARHGDGAVVTVDAGTVATSDGAAAARAEDDQPSPWARFAHGPAADPAWFPLGVWVQRPELAERWRDAGMTCYVGLWEGPTEAHLATLARARMPVICDQNAVGLAHRDDPTIIGWLLDDEPDNGHADEGAPAAPIPPEAVERTWRAWRAADPTRPVLLNLGEGVALDQWHQRGPRAGHPEDYPRYAAACDIASFDLYPFTVADPLVHGRSALIADGMRRLRAWAPPATPTWAILESGRISAAGEPPPERVVAQAWLAIAEGATGLVWFVHRFAPDQDEHALLEDPPRLAAVRALNLRLRALAPVLNAPTVAAGVRIEADAPIHAIVKRHGGAWWVIAVAGSDRACRAVLHLRGAPAGGTVEVRDEARSLPLVEGAFSDGFAPWSVHIYRIE